jgi:hypothetical protein
MPIDYAGVSPNLLVDTRRLQSTEKLSKQGNTLVRNNNGVCMAMVTDWIQKSSASPGGVTDVSQLKSGLALSLAQTAYMRGVFDTASGTSADDDSAFMASQGVGTNTSTTLKKKFFSTKKGRLEKIAVACGGLIGYALIAISGDGGHALGYRQTGGVVQFFDPNEGIMGFSNAKDFSKWFPTYIVKEYPDLTDSVTLTKAKV